MALETVGTIITGSDGKEYQLDANGDWQPWGDTQKQAGRVPGVPAAMTDVASGVASTLPSVLGDTGARAADTTAGTVGQAIGHLGQFALGGGFQGTGALAKAGMRATGIGGASTGNAVFDKVRAVMPGMGKPSPDKIKVMQAAEDAGLMVPTTYRAESPTVKAAAESLKTDVLAGGVTNMAGRANEKAFNATFAEAIGLPKGRAVTTQSLQEARTAASEGYRSIENVLKAPSLSDEALNAAMQPGDFVGGDKAAKLVAQHLEAITKAKPEEVGQRIMRARSVFNNESGKAAVKGDLAKSEYFDNVEDALMESSAKAAGGEIANRLRQLNSQWAAIRLGKKPGVLGPDGKINSASVRNWARGGAPNTDTPLGRLTNQANLLHDMGATVGNSGTAPRLGGPVTGTILGTLSTGAGINLFGDR